MVMTRSRSRTRKQLYRSRVKSSHCRNKYTRCRRRNGCKRTTHGTIKSYCRKSSNKRV